MADLCQAINWANADYYQLDTYCQTSNISGTLVRNE